MMVETGTVSAPGIDDMCVHAIAGGVDIIGLRAPDHEMALALVRVCRDEDAIFLVSGDVDMAASAGAAGVHFDSVNGPLGLARAVLGLDAIVGISAGNMDDATLALEVGADLVVYDGGTGCPAAFAALRGAGVPLFAGGIGSLEDAAQIVEGGVYRLCIGSGLVADGDVTGNAAAYSRLLGRCI